MAQPNPLAKTSENRQVSLLRQARESATVDAREITSLLWGGEDVVRKRRGAFERVEKQLGTHDTSKLPACYAHTDRDAIYEQGLRMGGACLQDTKEHGHDVFTWITPRYNLTNASPFGHKAVLFEPAVEHNGTEEQKAKWLPLIYSGKILGTYAQTELGHGSFVRGLETTATFDKERDEFTIHSPTASSTKFWPAGLAYSTTHAIVMAQLLVEGVSHGPHLFVAQIRSVEDGMPLPGVKMGDIGMKMGYNEADNGFATFDSIRIPRENMLAAHAQLARDGTYSKSPLRSKLSYSVMLLVRSRMPGIFALQLSQATTIATRYSVVREQGLASEGSGAAEASIIQYKHQHFRLLTLISKSYAMFFAGRACEVAYAQLRQQQERGDHSYLPSIHALTAGMKAYVTAEAAAGAEDARKLCGGHGYLSISGLPDIIGACAGGATFEGENYVLWQQVGRYLLKQVDALQQGHPVDEQLQYLASKSDTPCAAASKQFLNAEVQLEIYAARAHRLITKAHRTVRGSSKPSADAWNEHMMFIVSASRAHIEYLTLKAFTDTIGALPSTASTSLTITLTRVRDLFALSTIINPGSVDALSFIETTATNPSYLSSAQLDTIRDLVDTLLLHLLPEVVALTDAWDFSDASLCSALGMYDGNVYENIMRWVQQMPINKNASHGTWAQWVDPILQGRAQKAKL